MRPIPDCHSGLRRWLITVTLSGLSALTLGAPVQALASDGCLVLLCLAAPSWKSIPQCIEPVRDVFRDLARGRPFPSCSMSGAGGEAKHQPAYAPSNCPEQYTDVTAGVNLPIYTCRFTGVVSVAVNGQPWSRVWWNHDDSVTEYLPAARSQLGTFETRFDDDLVLWRSSRIAPPPEQGN